MNGKSAIIIGASRGIGLALAGEMAGRGWQVTATARGDAPDLASLAAASEGRITLATVDIDDDASCAALDVALTGRDFDLVFVNAGTYGPAHQSVDKVTPAEMGALMMTNAIAPVRLAKRLLPKVRPGGTVALMTSILGSVALNEGGTTALYRASKAGLNIIARGFYVEDVKPRGLTLLNLHPGWVKTEMGGPQAPVEIADSVRGLADVIAANTDGGHHYLDYQGTTLPWQPQANARLNPVDVCVKVTATGLGSGRVNFDFSDDAKALGEQARKLFADKAGTAAARLAMAKDAPAFDAGLWAEIAGLGWTAARVPEAHGGLGMSAEESCMLADAAGATLACVPLVSTLLATEALLIAGSEAQQAAYFPGIADGSRIAVVAWNEPGAANPQALSIKAEGGRLHGVKAPVADLPGAHLAIVAAAGADGPSLWLVDLAATQVEAIETLDLVRRHGRLTLDGVAAEPLGTAADYQAWLDRAAVILAYEAIGTATAAMTMTVEYAKTRVAFGQTIGRYQGVKHKCADMFIKIELARAHALHGVAMIASNGAELRQAAAAARVASLEAASFCGEEAVQLHGGIGFTWESDCQFYYRRARTLSAALGGRGWWADRLVRALEMRNRAAA